MNSDQLFKFKTVTECSTLTKAAEKLYVSQPALSYTINSLEKELGCQLFIREKNKLLLSDAGRELLVYANAVSDLLDRAEHAIRNRDTISISATNIIATMILQNYPDDKMGDIKLITAPDKDLPQLLFDGKLDIATCDDYYMRNMIQKHPEVALEKFLFHREQLALSVPVGNPLYNKTNVKYEDILNMPLAMCTDYNTLVDWVKEIEGMLNIKFNIQYPFDHLNLNFLRHKIHCPEICRMNSILQNPARAKDGKEFRLIPFDDLYAVRYQYVWYLKEKAKKVRPVMDIVRNMYVDNTFPRHGGQLRER